jgi:hypothetical protein
MTMKLEIDDLSHPAVHALLNEHLQATPNVEIENRPGVELAVDALADGTAPQIATQPHRLI